MKSKYEMLITNGAQEDINQYIDIIAHTCPTLQKATEHYNALFAELRRIKKYPKANPLIYNSALPYGINLRRARFNHTTALYTINGHHVYLHRIFYHLYRFRLSATDACAYRVLA